MDRPGEGQGAQRRFVDPHDRHHRVDAAGQDDAARPRCRLHVDVRVVPVDAHHQEVEDRHRDHHDVGAVHELRDQHQDEDDARGRGAQEVDPLRPAHRASARRLPDRPELPAPVPHHPRLAERERDEDTDDVELDELRDVGVEDHDQQAGDEGQEQDAVAEDQSIAAPAELPWEVAVAGQQRREDRKAVVGRVRGQHEDRRGERLQGVEDGAGTEHGQPDLAERGLLGLPGRHPGEQARVLGHVHVRDHRQCGDAREHHDGQSAHDRQGRCGVARPGGPEARYAVAHRLHAGERRAAAGERAQGEEDREQTAGAVVGDEAVRGALGGQGLSECEPYAGHGQQDEHDRHESVCGHREHAAGLLHPAQVDDGEQDDQAEGQGHRVGHEHGHRRGDRGDARDDRDGDGQHVVDEQRAGRDESGPGAEVPAADRVGPAAVRIGVARLPVGGDDDDQQRDHADGQPRREVQHPQAAQSEHEDDLLGRVGHGAEWIRAEDGEGEPLRQEGLAEPVGAQGAADEQALRGL
jgi:hypothetical protein